MKSYKLTVGSYTKTVVTTSTSIVTTLDLSTVPTGPATLTIVATDATDATDTKSVPIIRDDAPRLDVGTHDYVTAFPTTRLFASCTDTDTYPCTKVEVLITVGAASPVSLGSTAGTPLDVTPPLGGYDGAVTYTFRATDAAGATTQVTRSGFVEHGPNLVAEVSTPGRILAFDGTRVIYATKASTVLRSITSGTDTVLATRDLGIACLTSLGAVWRGGELRSGVSLTNDADPDHGRMVCSGDAVAYDVGSLPPVLDLYLRDVAADKLIKVRDKGTGTSSLGTFDVSANGDVVYEENPTGLTWADIYRYHAGLVSPVSLGAPRRSPKTDGVNVVYAKWGISSPSELFYWDGSEHSLSSCLPEPTFVLNGGWIAYSDCGATGSELPMTTRVRSPSGDKSLISILAEDSRPDAVSSGGDVVFHGNVKQWLGGPGKTPSLFSSHHAGTPFARSSVWYLIEGDTVFRYAAGGSTGDAGADGAAPETGTDAGEDADTGPAAIDADAAEDSSADDTASAADSVAETTAIEAGTDAEEADASPDADASVAADTAIPATDSALDTGADADASSNQEDSSGCSLSPTHAAGSFRPVSVTILALALATRRRRRAAYSHRGN